MTSRPWVWVDFENTPHVLFLEPFVRRLREDGCDVRISAKPQSQTLELAAARRLNASAVGGGDFAGLATKVFGGGRRAIALTFWARRQGGRPQLLVSSSRSAAVGAFLMRVSAVSLLDYEHTALGPFGLGGTVWLPDVLRHVSWRGAIARRARFYAGLKENLYLDHWRFDRAAERQALGVENGSYLVVARPPATSAHYAADASVVRWIAAVEGVLRWTDARVIVSPRTAQQREAIDKWLGAVTPSKNRLTVLNQVVPGPGLVAAADLVVGAGGTMNREAAVLGVPVWSAFCGPTPAIDAQLAAEGRLCWIRTEQELAVALAGPRPAPMPGRRPFPGGFEAIYTEIRSLLKNAARPGAVLHPEAANLGDR